MTEADRALEAMIRLEIPLKFEVKQKQVSPQTWYIAEVQSGATVAFMYKQALWGTGLFEDSHGTNIKTVKGNHLMTQLMTQLNWLLTDWCETHKMGKVHIAELRTHRPHHLNE